MGTKDIQSILNELWAATIKETKFDLLLGKISFLLVVKENHIKTTHHLEILEVSSFYYLKGEGEERFSFYELDKDSYLEMTSIDFYAGGVGDIKINGREEWVKQYFSNANIAIEIWDSLLFIEAKKLTLNGKIYDL